MISESLKVNLSALEFVIFNIIFVLIIGMNRDCNPTSIDNSAMLSFSNSRNINERNIVMQQKITLSELQSQKFGRLKVLREISKYPQFRIRRFECLCDCGNITNVFMSSLRAGHIKSCGCLHKEMVTKHGLYKSQEYHVWHLMKLRCNNKNDCNYKNYGERGIRVCDRWIYSFGNFLEDMGKKPFPEAQIDRIDNNGNYEPSNCRWVTRTTNNRNRSISKLTMIDAVNIRSAYLLGCFTYKEIAMGYGVSRGTVGDIIRNKTWRYDA